MKTRDEFIRDWQDEINGIALRASVIGTESFDERVRVLSTVPARTRKMLADIYDELTKQEKPGSRAGS